MDYSLIPIITVVAAIGAALFFVGTLFSLITALGNKHYIFGIMTLIFMPISMLYCALNWDKASFPGRLVFTGGGLLLVSIVVVYCSIY